ncbi:MAG: GNAT family N-acetyltransferase [Planctomycetota bacterium]|jgi:RimJ/RimL family protein N-acetyltransferase|nr:GNAT family N-acetyltransferase [Planctomycetota bacterium]
MRLVGDRILLREWRGDELEAMHAWLGDPRVARYLSWGASSREETAEHLAHCVAVQREPVRRQFFLALEHRGDGQVLGDAGFEWADGPGGEREGAFGYFLGHDHWGHGYATEAAQLIVDEILGDPGVHAARASCDARNTRSERVMQKCGLLRAPEREEPGRRVYLLTRESWRERLRTEL